MTPHHHSKRNRIRRSWTTVAWLTLLQPQSWTACAKIPTETAHRTHQVLAEPSWVRQAQRTAEPPPKLTQQDLELAFLNNPSSLGAASIGLPTKGWLLNPTQLLSSNQLAVQHPERAWGTPELVNCIRQAIARVHEDFPDSPALDVGDLSTPRGGWLSGHRSHQAGTDADLGYFYRIPTAWYTPATRKNLDPKRTWHLVKTLLTTCTVIYIFIDATIQDLLKEYAHSADTPSWVDPLFASRTNPSGPIRHAWGHRTHLHLRIAATTSESMGLPLGPLVNQMVSRHRWP